jgi:hypothetical protein
MINPQIAQHINDSLASSANAEPPSFLKQLAERLLNHSRQAAERNNSQVVNDIPEKFVANKDERILAEVIKGMLTAVINNAKDTCIRISAKLLYGNKVEVLVKDPNSYHSFALACGLQDVFPLAAKIGGDINITSHKKKVTTVSFVFPA